MSQKQVRNKAIASSCSFRSVKPLPVQRPQGSWWGCICMHVCVFLSKDGGRFGAPNAVLFHLVVGKQTPPFSFLYFILCLSQSVILSENSSLEMGGPQHKISSLHTQAIFFFLLLFIFCPSRHWWLVAVGSVWTGKGYDEDSVWVVSENSIYSQMWTEEHCRGQAELVPSFLTMWQQLCVCVSKFAKL